MRIWSWYAAFWQHCPLKVRLWVHVYWFWMNIQILRWCPTDIMALYNSVSFFLKMPIKLDSCCCVQTFRVKISIKFLASLAYKSSFFAFLYFVLSVQTSVHFFFPQPCPACLPILINYSNVFTIWLQGIQSIQKCSKIANKAQTCSNNE